MVDPVSAENLLFPRQSPPQAALGYLDCMSVHSTCAWSIPYPQRTCYFHASRHRRPHLVTWTVCQYTLLAHGRSRIRRELAISTPVATAGRTWLLGPHLDPTLADTAERP